ncbi:MAG: hypothetical protein NVS2B11_05350 [Acetobacteraceae bacterium]
MFETRFDAQISGYTGRLWFQFDLGTGHKMGSDHAAAQRPTSCCVGRIDKCESWHVPVTSHPRQRRGGCPDPANPPARAQEASLRIGVLTDLSGVYEARTNQTTFLYAEADKART